jgi:hypothetical protein
MELAASREFQLAIVIVVAMIIAKLISLLVDSAYRRGVTTDYVTRSECVTCKNAMAERRSELSMQIRFIKGLLLIVAIKVGVPEDQLKELIEK